MAVVRDQFIPNGRPYLDDADYQAVQRLLTQGGIADGDDIGLFETEFAAAMDCASAVAVGSGFAALHLCLIGLNIGPGDEVIIPCVSTCHAIRNAVLAVGATPVFADTNRCDFNLSVESLAVKLTPQTRAIIAPHHTGIPSDISAFNQFGVPVIEDCAQAMGAISHGHPVGSLGFASIFSFYATKMMTTVDGGMVASQSIEFLEQVKNLRYYKGKWDSELRYNYKLQNLHAALGRTQLAKLPFFLERRKAIAAQYLQLFSQHGFDQSVALHRVEGSVYYRFGMRFPPAARERLIDEFRAENIPFSVEVGFLTNGNRAEYKNADQLTSEALTFPVYPALTDVEVEMLMQEIGKILNKISIG